MKYITLSEYQEVEIDVDIEKIFDHLTDDQLLEEMKKRTIGDVPIVNGYTKHLKEVMQEILDVNTNHLEVALFLESKYLNQ